MDAYFHFAAELLLFYIGFSSIYLFVFAVASQFKRYNKYPKDKKSHKYAVLVPDHHPMPFMEYPSELHRVIFYKNWAETAMSLSEDEFDAVVILGETDRVSSDFFHEINRAYDVGVKAIQLHHEVEPRSSMGKKMAAIHEEVQNSLFKQGYTGVGFSSAMDGIDMVLDLVWLKSNMKTLKTNIELRLLNQNIFIEYLEYVTVYSASPRKPKNILSRRKALTRFLSVLFAGKWNYASRLLLRFIPSWTTLLLFSIVPAIVFTCTDWANSIEWWGMILFQLLIVSLAIPDYLVGKNKKSQKLKNGK